MKIRYLFLFCSILLLSISCLVKKTTYIPNIKDTKWILVSLGDTTVKIRGLNSLLHFGLNQEIHVIAVCNTISGRYAACPGKNGLHFSSLVISYIGCRHYKTEAILLDALKRTNQYTIRKDTLLLLHNNKKLATYKKAEQP